MLNFYKKIIKHNFSVFLVGISAIDYYLHNKIKYKNIYTITNANIIDISKCFEDVYSVKNPFFDICIKEDNYNIFIACDLTLEKLSFYCFNINYFFYDLKNKKFITFFDSYSSIKSKNIFIIRENNYLFFELVQLISRYNVNKEVIEKLKITFPKYIPEQFQKEIFINILESDYSYLGLDFLLKSGFIEKYWKEIYYMVNIEHTKDYHPEGDLWQHSLEVLKYTKNNDLRLKTALFLHDIGKYCSLKTKNYPFYKHAEIGSKVAKKFLKRLEFDENFIKTVAYLIKYHMLPSALLKFPKSKQIEFMKNENFKLLLELYKADISSSYKSLENFYKIKKHYKEIKRWI